MSGYRWRERARALLKGPPQETTDAEMSALRTAALQDPPYEPYFTMKGLIVRLEALSEETS